MDPAHIAIAAADKAAQEILSGESTLEALVDAHGPRGAHRILQLAYQPELLRQLDLLTPRNLRGCTLSDLMAALEPPTADEEAVIEAHKRAVSILWLGVAQTRLAMAEGRTLEQVVRGLGPWTAEKRLRMMHAHPKMDSRELPAPEAAPAMAARIAIDDMLGGHGL